ncbi:hypothetical protein HK097_009645, partial [Rhizophlyctis rosea]
MSRVEHIELDLNAPSDAISSTKAAVDADVNDKDQINPHPVQTPNLTAPSPSFLSRITNIFSSPIPPPYPPQVLPTRTTSSFLGKWTYSYMNEMMRRGVKRELVQEEFPAVEIYDEAERLSDKLMREWDAEVKKRGVQQARLWRALVSAAAFESRTELGSRSCNATGDLVGRKVRAFGVQYSLAGVAYLVEVVVVTLSSIFLGYLLRWFQNPNATSKEGFLWAMTMSLSTFAHAVLHHVEFYLSMRTGLHLRTTFTTTLYRTLPTLTTTHTSSTGAILSLLSNDIQRFEDAAPFAHFIWVGPLHIVIVAYFMWTEVGYSAFASLAVLVGLIPLQGAFARRFGSLRGKVSEWRDERIKRLSDMLGGVLVVKLYAWETPFIKSITALRNVELKYIRRANILRAINEGIYFASSALIMLPAVLVFHYTQSYSANPQPLTPSRIFTLLTYISAVRLSMANFFPKALQFVSESWVSLERIEGFLKDGCQVEKRDVEGEEAVLRK